MRARYRVDSVTQRSDGLKSAKLMRVVPLEREQDGIVVIGGLEVTSGDASVEQMKIGREFHIDFTPAD